MNSEPRLPLIVLAACFVTRADPDLMAKSPKIDHLRIVGEALLLLVMGGITGLAWSAFWGEFLPWPIAVALGLVAAVFMILIDQAIGAADWRLAGILRRPDGRGDWKGLWRLLPRFALTAILSLATSIGASMAMFHDTIAAQLDKDRREQNQQIEQHYAQLEHEQAAQHHGRLLKLVNDLTADIAKITPPLDDARQLAATAGNRLKANQDEAQNELKGAPGYHAGPGQKYRVALDEQKKARADLVNAQAAIAIYEPRLNGLQQQLQTASADLKAAEAAFEPMRAQLEEEKQRHLIPARSDALLSYLALEEVFASPVVGRPAQHFAKLMMAVLMTIELSYVLVRAIFRHASIYDALLIADTHARAERIAADGQRERETLRGPRGKPAPLRMFRFGDGAD